jgi:hypothetical protein
LGGVKQDKGALEIVIVFVIGIILLWKSLSLAQYFGVHGSNMTMGMATKVRQGAQKRLGGATFGMGARLGRAIPGRIGNALAESDKLKDYASRSSVGRVLLKGSRAVGDASFDARNINDFGKNTGLGEGRKGGYKTVKEEVAKKEAEFGKSLGTVGDEDVRVQARKKEMEAAKRLFDSQKVQLREDQKKAATPKDAADIQAKIDKLEKDANDAKINYEKEKQRRILGSTFADEDRDVEDQARVENIERDIKKKKEEIKNKWEKGGSGGQAYTDLKDEKEKTQLRNDVATLNKQLKVLEESSRKYQNTIGDQGYAGALESKGVLTSWATGHLRVHNREAGKEMRKAAEKGLPKEKE